MITKSDLKAVFDQMTAEERQKLPEPPTVEEMLAYRRGDLSGEDEARVREMLICYPELLRALSTPLPDDAGPEDPDYLSEEQLDRRWDSLQQHIHGSRDGRVLQFRAALAIAATLAVVFGALFWHERMELRKPQVVWEQLTLLPDGRRGGGEASTPLTANEPVLLVPSMVNQAPYDTYRLEIVDMAVDPPRSLLKSEAMPKRSDGSVAILVGPEFFKPGKYKLLLYGVSGARQEPLSTYSFHVPSR